MDGQWVVSRSHRRLFKRASDQKARAFRPSPFLLHGKKTQWLELSSHLGTKRKSTPGAGYPRSPFLPFSLSLSHYLGDLIKSHGFKHYLLMTPKFILITQTTTQTADSYIHISTSPSNRPLKLSVSKTTPDVPLKAWSTCKLFVEL